MPRFISLAAVLGLLALLGACARQEQPTATPEGSRFSARTPVPTPVPISASLPIWPPSVEFAGEPPAPIETAVQPSPQVSDPAVTPLSTEPPQPVCARQARAVDCDLGDLQAGDAVSLTLDLSMPTGMATPAAEPASPATTALVLQAEGPTSVIAGRPYTFTYVISNQGALDATGVWFEDAIPSDMNLVAYAPGVPECEQQGDAFTCALRDLDGGEPVTFTLIITGYGQQPMTMSLDPLLPGWPICTVLKERTWLHIVQCELGDLRPGQATRVQLVLTAIGVVERTTTNTASVRANEPDLSPADNTITTTISIRAGTGSSGD